MLGHRLTPQLADIKSAPPTRCTSGNPHRATRELKDYTKQLVVTSTLSTANNEHVPAKSPMILTHQDIVDAVPLQRTGVLPRPLEYIPLGEPGVADPQIIYLFIAASSSPEEFNCPKPCKPRTPLQSLSAVPEPTRALKSPSRIQQSLSGTPVFTSCNCS